LIGLHQDSSNSPNKTGAFSYTVEGESLQSQLSRNVRNVLKQEKNLKDTTGYVTSSSVTVTSGS